MGCTPESFKKRSTTDKHNQLNQTLRSRPSGSMGQHRPPSDCFVRKRRVS